jgi:hypothetical protein
MGAIIVPVRDRDYSFGPTPINDVRPFSEKSLTSRRREAAGGVAAKVDS